MTAEQMLGFVVVLFTAAGIGFFSLKQIRAQFPALIRKIPPIARLKRAIGLSVEDGSRVHVSLGSPGLTEPASTSALVGLSTLHRVGQLSSTSDQPPVCTSGEGNFALLSKDVLRGVAVETNTYESYDPDQGWLTGITPFSYALGAMEVISDPIVKTNILVGNFGAEAALLSSAAERRQTFTLAASHSLVGQAIFLATSRDVLLGEELYALPAYLNYRPAHLASLRVQDILRFIVGAALLAGALLRALGVL